MARALQLLIASARLPQRAALQATVQALGFATLVLDAGAAPLSSPGYLPCTLDGEDAGVDLRRAEAEMLPGDDRDLRLTLHWSGDAREQACALILAAALAQDSGALVHADGTAEVLTAADLVAQATRAVTRL